MPINFRFLNKHQLLIAQHVGTTGDREFVNSYNEAFLDPRYSTRSKTLVDLRNAKSGNRSIDGLKQISELIASFRKNRTTSTKIAIIAPSDLAFGLSRIFEAISSDHPTEVMVGRRADEILDFLDLTADDLDEC